MKHRFSLFCHSAATLIVFIGLAGTAWSRHPLPRQMDAVQRLAWQLSADSATLANTAREQRHHDSAREDEAVARFEELRRAADHFYRQATRYAQDPVHTESDYLQLRDAYRRARRYFDAVHGTQPVQLAIQRTHDSMSNLIGYYEAESRGPITISTGEIQRTASQIEQLADRLEERAENQERRGRVSDDDVKRIDRVNDAAKHFYEQVEKYQGDPKRIDEEYRELVRRLLDANAVMGSFSLGFQDDFGALWNLSQSLNFLAPDSAVGAPPYGRRDY